MGRSAWLCGAATCWIVGAAGTGALAQANPATARDDASGVSSVEEVVVTAQKRSQSLQDVPLAVTAVTAERLEQADIRDLSGMVALVPNLNLGPQLGVAKIALRGIGLENLSPGAEGSIAFHVDGVFVSRSIGALASFYDVEQVEALRGPQGTLYGRNATGGSINILSRRPTRDLSGYVNATFGSYSRVAVDGAISGPLVPDVLLGRVAFQMESRDGFGKNLHSGRDIDDLNTRSVRGKLLFMPTDRLSLEVTADFHRQKDASGSYHYAGPAGFSAPGVPYPPSGIAYGGEVSADMRDINTDTEPSNDVRIWGLSAQATYELSDTLELKSITGYRNTRYDSVTDLDSTTAPLAVITQLERAEQFSEELQLSGDFGRLTWLLGGYYFHEEDYGAQVIPFNNFLVGFPAPGTYVEGAFFGGEIETTALAAFGQATYEVADGLKLTLGARYSSERKRNFDQFLFDFTTPYDPAASPPLTTLRRSKRFKSFTPRVAIDYQAAPDVLLYASWSEGFKAGTYNLGQLQAPVEPEQVTAWEGGFKSYLADRRVRLNVAGFHYSYEDLQIGKIQGQVLALENAATATIYGLEAELQAQLTPQFEIDANAAWLHARFDRYISGDPARTYGDGLTVDPETGAPAFNLAGNRLSQAPDFTLFAGAQYTFVTAVGEFTLRGEVSWRDRVYFTPFNVDYVSQKANTRINAFLNWSSPSGAVRGSLFVKNLTNEKLIGNAYVSSPLLGSPVQAYLEEPRTLGVRLGYRF